MAQLLAPYNNSMRLGQGFNSYTHQICLHNAVTVPRSSYLGTPSTDDEWVHAEDEEYQPDPEDEPEEKAQIVTYSTRFVEKISEVVDSMNISAALSINTNMIGGSANGQYIDSDKFKESDMNYFVQVRVTNQRIDKKDHSKLNIVNSVKAPRSDPPPDPKTIIQGTGDIGALDLTKFRDVYGDTFISGWEEGGELNALISVKSKNKSKATTIKAAIEGRLGTPALTGKVSGSVDIEKSDAFSESETTITVNWSGGGKIKDYDILWDINSLTLAAANFPDRVMKTPQRTYAILSRYNELPDFQNKLPNYSALDYDLAGVYTYALLDMYTDYKSVWKTLQITSSDVEARHTKLEEPRVDPETLSFLVDYKPKPKPKPVGDQQASDQDKKFNVLGLPLTIDGKITPFKATLIGLQRAKTACRLQMLRIVGEVDDLRADPSLALKSDTGDILAPAIFRQLLPVAIPVAVNPNEEWIEPLGTSFSPQHLLTTANFDKFTKAKTSASLNADKAKNYRMSKWAGPEEPGKDANFTFTNDLDRLNMGLVIDNIRVFWDPEGLTGISILYTNMTRAKHGSLQGKQNKQFALRGKTVLGAQFVENVVPAPATGQPDSLAIIHMALSLSDLKVESVTCRTYKPSSRQVVWTTAPAEKDLTFDLAGFYTNFNSKTQRIESIGVIWGNDTGRTAETILPPHVDLQYFPSKLQEVIKPHLNEADTYRLSDFAGDFSFDNEPATFLDLGKIGADSHISNLVFCWGTFGDSWSLCGLQATWKDSKQQRTTVSAGTINSTNIRTWSDGGNWYRITGADITTGRAQGGNNLEYVTFISFEILDELTGKTTPINSNDPIPTAADAPADKKKPRPTPTGHSVVVRQPDESGWSIRGFYGQSGTIIDRLGVVWGKDADK